MATKNHLQHITCPAWSPSHGFVKCAIQYRVRFVKERWRRLLALVFAALITLIVATFVVAIEPVQSSLEAFMLAAVSIVGMTLIALIFGIEINDVKITKDGAFLNFGESQDDD